MRSCCKCYKTFIIYRINNKKWEIYWYCNCSRIKCFKTSKWLFKTIPLGVIRVLRRFHSFYPVPAVLSLPPLVFCLAVSFFHTSRSHVFHGLLLLLSLELSVPSISRSIVLLGFTVRMSKPHQLVAVPF